MLAGVLLLPLPAVFAQIPSFRSGIELVEVAVVVRDQDGRLVRDLTQADFQIVEHGTAQKVAAFDRVSIPVVRASETAAASIASHDVASNERAGEFRVFVLVLDALHVAATRTRDVRAQARHFIEQQMGTTDLVAVISPGGLESATQDFTSDKVRLLAAVDQFAGSKLRSAAVEIEEERLAAERGGEMLHAGKDPSDHERAGRAQSLANVLETLARHLDRIEHRRKSVLLFSEGIDYDQSDVLGKVQTRASDATRAMGRAVDALMRTNVSVYAIDPRGLSSAEGDLLETPLFRTTPSRNTGPSPEAEYTSSIVSLRNVSDSTGGFAAVDRKDFSGVFERIIEESSDYYVLGYTPERAARPGEFRELRVTVSRPGLRVLARKGYTAAAAQPRTVNAAPSVDPIPAPPSFGGRPGLGRSADRSAPEVVAPSKPGLAAGLDALLASPLPRAGLPIRVQVIPFRGDDKKGVVELVIEVLGHALQFSERGGRFEERIDLALLTVDARARAANGQSAAFDLHLTPDQFQNVKATGVRWLQRLELAPGHHQVRIAGRATRTGTTGLVTADIDVPRFQPDRASLSGVTLTSLRSVQMITEGSARLSATLKMPPSAARTFVTGDQVRAVVEVYMPAASPPVEVIAQLEGPEGSGNAPIETSATASRDRTAVAFPIDTAALSPGRYLLHVVLKPNGATDEHRRVPFEVSAPPQK